MIYDFLSGASYFLRGFKMVIQPELRRFILIPFIINTLVFTAAISFGIYQFDYLMDWIFPQENSWWIEFFRITAWVFFSIIVLMILFFTFTLVANLIGAPFNGTLSEKVEVYLSGNNLQSSAGIRDFISTILPSIVSELKKLLYFLLLGGMIFLFLLIPGLNIISPLLWVVFTSWMFSLEYIAYPMENHKIYFSQARKELRKKRVIAFGFGMAVMIVNTIPIVNFLVMPAAVAGATALWVERLKNS